MITKTAHKESIGIKRAAGLVLAILLLALVMFSTVFIAHEADHECAGEDCPVCELIMQCTQALHSLGETLAFSAAAFAVSVVFISTLLFSCVQARTLTPISLKVRLNN